MPRYRMIRASAWTRGGNVSVAVRCISGREGLPHTNGFFFFGSSSSYFYIYPPTGRIPRLAMRDRGAVGHDSRCRLRPSVPRREYDRDRKSQYRFSMEVGVREEKHYNRIFDIDIRGAALTICHKSRICINAINSAKRTHHTSFRAHSLSLFFFSLQSSTCQSNS